MPENKKNQFDYNFVRFGDYEISVNDILYFIMIASILFLISMNKKYTPLIIPVILVIYEY